MKTDARSTETMEQTAGSKRALLEVNNLRVEYLTTRGNAQAVSDVTFSIDEGRVFGLAGESGCGKSTIAHSIMRVLRPPAVITGGEVFFEGQDLLKMTDSELEDFRWSKMSMVFQSAVNALNPVVSVGKQIRDVLKRHTDMTREEVRERAAELFEIVGIDSARLESFPHEMSGGMRQRAVIAIALALNPKMMIMDEPTTALDVVVQKDILQQIQELKERMGFSIFYISHDLSQMVEISDEIAIMYAGEIVERADAREIFDNPMHPYTQGLLGSFPSLSGPKRKLTGIPGSPPDLIDPPKGCRFHPRCKVCTHKENEVRPVLTEVKPGHWVATHESMPLPGTVT